MPNRALPEGHAIHPDPTLDSFLGEMVARRRCELDTSHDEYIEIVCPCPQQHLKVVRLYPEVVTEYAQRKIAEIANEFTCC